MTIVSSKDLINKFVYLRGNPNAMQRLVLNVQEDITNGEHITVDPTTPFANIVESICVIGSAFMTHADTIVRKLYPANASNVEELYLHMADKDFIGRFSAPARGEIVLMLSLEEILAKAVTVNSSIKKITIPRYTEFNIGGYTFTMQYPIDISVLPTGSINIFYDVSSPSPLYNLESNIVDWGITGIGLTKVIVLRIAVMQMAINSQTVSLNNVTGLYKEFSFVDKFYYCRAFTKNANEGTWDEIKTTHTEQVYDANTPTLVLKVLETSLAVRLPQIYFNNNVIKDTLRVDIYTTKGALEINLSGIAPDKSIARWVDRDVVGTSTYSAPLNTFSGLSLFMENAVTGGSNGLGFTELREKVITNGLTNVTKPITDEQLSNSLQQLGYNVVNNIDDITGRQFLAVRELPPPVTEETITGAGCAVKMLQIRLSDLVQYSTVEDHGERVTIKPETLFRLKNGILSLVTDTERNSLVNQVNTNPEILANTVNNDSFYYTPFHYVLDTSNNIFDTRVYSMNKPAITKKFLVESNPSMLVNSSSLTHGVYYDSFTNRYVLTIEVAATQLFKSLPVADLYLQLSYIPPGFTQRVFYNAELITPIDTNTGRPLNDRYIYNVYLDTRFDIDVNNLLLLESTQTPVNLEQSFDLVYFVKNYVPLDSTISDIDAIFDASVLNDYDGFASYRGFTHESITIEFGEYLEKLWTRSRSVVSNVLYQKYAADVPAVYTSTVYLTDSTGNVVLTYNSLEDDYDLTILHNAGDPILDENNQPVMKHKAGDVVLDANGDPVPLGGAQGMLRQFDLMLVDGRYYFANDTATVSYKEEFTKLLVNWITTDLELLSDNLLELTELYFYPKTTSGSIDVIVNSNELVKIKAEQTFRIDYYVREDVYNNNVIRAAIESKTAKVLDEVLTNSTISVFDLAERLKEEGGNDILSVIVKGFTNDEYDIITLNNPSVKPVIGKKLSVLSNKTLAVENAIAIEFISHLPRTA